MQDKNLPKLPYKEVAGTPQIFADGVAEFMFFNGRAFKLTLTTDRYDTIKPPKPPSGNAVSVAHLVLDVNAAVDIHNKLSQVMGALEAQGLVVRDGDKLKPTLQ